MPVDQDVNPPRPPTFRAVSHSYTTLPFRKRPTENPAYVRFADPDGETRAVEVFVKNDVIKSMRQIADRSWPDEAIGLLAGRACRDADGTYTIIDAVEAATADECEATPGSVHLSGPGSATIRERLARQHPTLDPDGWFHSHPYSDAFFSSQDLTEQATWPDPYNVGIVLGDRRGHRTLNIYTGPHAHRLTRIDANGTDPLPTPHPTASVRSGRPPVERRDRPRPTIDRPLLRVAFALVVVVCFVLVVLLLLSSSNQYAQATAVDGTGRLIALPEGEPRTNGHPQ